MKFRVSSFEFRVRALSLTRNSKLETRNFDRSRSGGFTLLELMIVISILVIRR